MFFTRGRLATVFFIFLAIMLGSASSYSQTSFEFRASEAPSLRAAPETLRERCAFRLANSPGWVHFALDTESRSSASNGDFSRNFAASAGTPCAEMNFTPSSTGIPPAKSNVPPGIPPRSPIAPPVDTTSQQLFSFGKLGVPVARARVEVLAILGSDNACAEWFAAKDPAPADTFRSLTFSIDHHGPGNVLESNAPGGLRYYRQPYVARATQDGGPYTGITLNAYGAFFRESGNVQRVAEDGGLPRSDGTRLLTVGSYLGTSLEAQMVTLLHEFGHVIDLLPEDADNLDGNSVRNTNEVLRHCRPEIDARSKLLHQSARR